LFVNKLEVKFYSSWSAIVLFLLLLLFLIAYVIKWNNNCCSVLQLNSQSRFDTVRGGGGKSADQNIALNIPDFGLGLRFDFLCLFGQKLFVSICK